MIDRIEICISPARFETYLKAAGYDRERALELYFWNMRMAGSFYPLLSGIEICLRNIIVKRVSSVFGEDWFESAEFHELIGKKGKGIVLGSKGDIKRRRHTPTSGRMTAELSFGFWVNMLLKKYEEPLWQDISKWFPYAPPSASRANIREKAMRIKTFRNRISHHEPIIGRDLSADYSAALELLGWLEPAKRDWMKPRLETMKILRERP